MSAPRVAAVVLAAGGSTRLGAPKQLLLHDGEPLVRRAAAACLAAGATPVHVVVGADAARVTAAVAGLAGARAVPNAAWRDGLAASLAVGLHAALAEGPPACDAVLVTLADQPLVDAAALGRLLDALAASPAPAHAVVAASYAGTLGVPAVFGRAHAPDLLAATSDTGAGRWLRSRAAADPASVVAVPLDAAALDLDTPADIARWRGADATP